MVIDLNGFDFFWETIGEGEPLLWLHGGLGSGADWRSIFKEAPAGFRLIAPDLSGHGASTHTSVMFSFRQCALYVQALLRPIALPPITAIGLNGVALMLLHFATSLPAFTSSPV